MDDILSYYKLLDLQPGASQDEVKQAYRKQAMRWHPDRFPDNPQKQKEAEERIKALNIAYAYLREQGESQVNSSTVSSSSSSTNTSSQNRSSKIRYRTGRARAETYVQEASDLAKTGQYQEAADALSLAIRLDPDYAEAYHLRSLMFSSLGFSHRAKSDRDRARQLELEHALRLRREKDAQRAEAQRSPSPPQTRSSPASLDWHCQQTFSAHTDAVTDVAFAQNGKVLISSSLDGSVYLWNVPKGRQFAELSGDGRAVHAIAVSSDGQLVASGGDDGTVKLWHVRTSHLVDTFSGHTAPVLSLAFSPNRKVIVSGSADGTIRFWHVQHRGLLYVLDNHRAPVQAIAINPNGLTLASSDSVHPIITWDMQSGLCQQTALGSIHDALALEFSPNRRDLWVGRVTGAIQRLDAESGDLIAQFEGHQQAVHAVTINATGQVIASGSGDRTIRLWAKDGSHGILEGHEGSVNAVAFSPDGSMLASGSGDRTIKLWMNASD
ncbi:MAG: DnaJ domain-containing protein [Leptolyngbyaceae bacterium]|nr:DnaJ domain-containing protein [Leptolyngbyaceae bacterium]